MSNLELRSSTIELSIAPPGSSYQSTRFDWSSLAVSIIVDGKYQCAAAERPRDHPLFSRGGQGLSCEFGIRTPIGYVDCPVGEWFPKIGVGFIQRENDGDYDFFHHYENLRPLEYKIDHDRPVDAAPGCQSLTITGIAKPHRGYAWHMSRSWIVTGNHIENRCTLHNTGEKTLETTEYSHNFIQPGNARIGPGITLDFGFPLAAVVKKLHDPSGCLEMNHPSFKHVPGEEFFIGGLLEKPVDHAWWQLNSLVNKLSIREELDKTCIQADLWGKASVISPELFGAIRVEPGKRLTWSRHYHFGTG